LGSSGCVVISIGGAQPNIAIDRGAASFLRHGSIARDTRASRHAEAFGAPTSENVSGSDLLKRLCRL
jgi:hypothetical protein